LTDYSNSGYDRGHLVPAADITGSQKDLDQTFLCTFFHSLLIIKVTNVSPQVGVGFNRSYWAYFEKFARNLTRHFDDVYVITGPLFLPRKEEDGHYYVKFKKLGDPPNTSGPTHFFKGTRNFQD
jgi:endonuclease G